MAQRGNVQPNDQLWHPHYPNFVIANQVQGLFESSTPIGSATSPVYHPKQSENVRISQVQCPNCGGYKISEEDNKGCASQFLFHIILTIITTGIWIIVWLIIAAVESFKRKPDPTIHRYTCQLCGYAWTWKEGTPYPKIKVNPELVELGAKKLKEDEEAERRRQEEAAFHYLSQQGKK
jgi:hypothetical protein